MRRPARNKQQSLDPSQACIPSAGPPLVIGNHPILCWIDELTGSVVRRVLRWVCGSSI